MVSTATMTRTGVAALAAELDETWRCLDELFAGMRPKDWARKHGARWVFADLPYHLGYLDRECARVMGLGTDAPASARWLMHSEAEIDAWNASMFARRPRGQTVEQSLAEMRASRDDIREILAGSTDADLREPVWSPFFGWVPLEDGLLGLIGHSFNHFMEARMRLGRTAPVPSPAVVHRALGFYLGLMERMVDRDRARGADFTAVLAFTEPGGGEWTVRVADGRCRVTEGRAEPADLMLTQSPEAFVATFARVKNPMLLMLTGKIKVSGYRALGTFGRLFPPPSADPTRAWPVELELRGAPA